MTRETKRQFESYVYENADMIHHIYIYILSN